MPVSTSLTTALSDVPAVFKPYITDAGGALPTAQQFLSRGYQANYGDPLALAGLAGSGRVAGLAPMQQQIGQQIGAMGTPSQFGAGTGAATAGLGSLAESANIFQNLGRINAPGLTQFQMGPADVVYGQQNLAPQMVTAQTGYNPQLTAFQMGPAQQVGAQGVTSRDISAAQTGFSPQLERFQMTAPERFGSSAAQEYMSPYMQNVVDIQKREAVRDAQKAQLAQNLGAARQGTYGGARQLLATTERERALGQQLGDIQSRGSEAAFAQAQQQFERDRAAQMGAQRENLQAALGVQQLGTQTGLQAALANLSNEQQARVQSEANRLQASGMTQDAALRAALANQQAGLTVGQQNLASQLGVQQLGAQTGLQTSLANLTAAQQANVQNQAAQLQTQGLNAQQALQAALANQQAGITTGQQNLQALLGIQQLGAGQSMEAQRANQAAQIAAAQGLGQLAQTYGGLGQVFGSLGTAQQASDIDRLKTMGAYGDLQRAVQQQQLDAQYQDLMTRLNYPLTQAETISNLARGAPLVQTSTSGVQTTPAPSFASQLAGMGLTGLGLYNMFK